MTAGQLETLLRWYEQDDDVKRQKEGLGALQILAPSLARRVLAAEKLMEAIYNDASDQWCTNVNKAATAYRESSK